MTQPEPLVHWDHCRALRRRGNRRMCADGIRALCARYGVDVAQLQGPGVPGEVFRASGNHFALRALDVARAEQQAGSAADGQQ